MKIYAPVKDFSGFRNTVRFVRGVGETDNPSVIEWFESHGYIIEKSQNSVEKCDQHDNLVIEPQNDQVEVENDEVETIEDETPNFEKMNPNELREWAKAHGKGHLIKSTRNKVKLLEILRG